ncbi:MAG: hypothetical protein E7069_10495 [Bacteroidales bacterium]|jgi:RHS repeat-associated protein|nr:hypothetical protein [Bacteroidales bacterium]
MNRNSGIAYSAYYPEFDLIDMNFAIEREQSEYSVAYSAMPSVSKMGEANGRFYAPQLGRFLSPDPYVQNATNPQNFNRYSYCLNNPLKYTDPSGNMTSDTGGKRVGPQKFRYNDDIQGDGGGGGGHWAHDYPLTHGCGCGGVGCCACSNSGYSRKPKNDSQDGEWSAITISDPAAIEYFISSGLYSADMATISGWASTMARMGIAQSTSDLSFLFDTILLPEVTAYGKKPKKRSSNSEIATSRDGGGIGSSISGSYSGRGNFYASCRLSIGGQIGFVAFGALEAFIKLVSVDMVSITLSSQDGWTIKHSFNDDNMIIHQELSIGAGIPFIGELRIGPQRTFEIVGGHTKSDITQWVNFDGFKIEYSNALILGIDIELNYDL